MLPTIPLLAFIIPAFVAYVPVSALTLGAITAERRSPSFLSAAAIEGATVGLKFVPMVGTVPNGCSTGITPVTVADTVGCVARANIWLPRDAVVVVLENWLLILQFHVRRTCVEDLSLCLSLVCLVGGGHDWDSLSSLGPKPNPVRNAYP